MTYAHIKLERETTQKKPKQKKTWIWVWVWVWVVSEYFLCIVLGITLKFLKII